ncbi:hypothetical protein B0H13DRAFT_1630480, partial [Mycena leptocephala]
LVQAHEYFTKKQWGPVWTGLVAALVQYEWSHYHDEDRGRLGADSRPVEIPQWMKEHRVYDDYDLQPDFGERLLAWWKDLGPRRRWKDLETAKPSRDKNEWVDWGRLDVSGRNGPLLLVVGLAWWGQKIWNEGATEGLGGGKLR